MTPDDRTRAIALVAALRPGSTPERTEEHARERPDGNTAALIAAVTEIIATEREAREAADLRARCAEEVCDEIGAIVGVKRGTPGFAGDKLVEAVRSLERALSTARDNLNRIVADKDERIAAMKEVAKERTRDRDAHRQRADAFADHLTAIERGMEDAREERDESPFPVEDPRHRWWSVGWRAERADAEAAAHAETRRWLQWVVDAVGGDAIGKGARPVHPLPDQVRGMRAALAPVPPAVERMERIVAGVEAVIAECNDLDGWGGYHAKDVAGRVARKLRDALGAG